MLHMYCQCQHRNVLFSSQGACFMTTCICSSGTGNTALWRKCNGRTDRSGRRREVLFFWPCLCSFCILSISLKHRISIFFFSIKSSRTPALIWSRCCAAVEGWLHVGVKLHSSSNMVAKRRTAFRGCLACFVPAPPVIPVDCKMHPQVDESVFFLIKPLQLKICPKLL